MKIGIIGLGNFGRFAAESLARDKDLEVIGSDSGDISAPNGVTKVTLKEIATADVVVLCVPLSAYSELLVSLESLLKPETLVVDICSVKVEAEKRLRAGLPGHKNLLITHPMFGPQTAADGAAGQTLVVTSAEGEVAERAVAYCSEKLGLKIMHMTSEEHDRAMADVHALTFFIARGLTDVDVRAGAFDPPSFRRLLELSALDKMHTEDLFRTMEVGNPYAKSAREKFVKILQEINDKLDKETI